MAQSYNNDFSAIRAAENFGLHPDFNSTQPSDLLVAGPQNPTVVPSNEAFVPNLAQNDHGPQPTSLWYLGKVHNDQAQPLFPDFLGWGGPPATEAAFDPFAIPPVPSNGKNISCFSPLVLTAREQARSAAAVVT